MISYLKGKIILAREGFVILDVGGVGYKVRGTVNTLNAISKSEDEVELYIHQHIREDASDLYGFKSFEELDFFDIITSVSGIGPKIGLIILDISSIGDLKKAIAGSNVDYLTKVPGIGRKKAELIILQLKNKMDVIDFGGSLSIPDEDQDAVDALMGLGYKKHEAIEALKTVPADVEDSGEKIKQALKNFGKK